MSFSFASAKSIPYLGSVQALPISLGNRTQQKPIAVPFAIAWSNYSAQANSATSLAVQLSMLPGTIGVFNIDYIKSVKINNLGNPAPVYVVFPDTGDVVECPPFQIRSAEVVSNSHSPYVVCNNFNSATLGATTVIFSNMDFENGDSGDADLNFVLGSNGATPITAQDSLAQTILDLRSASGYTPIVGTSLIATNLFINSITAIITGMAGNQGAAVNHTLLFTNSAQTAFYGRAQFQTPTAPPAGFVSQQVFSLTGLNIRGNLNASAPSGGFGVVPSGLSGLSQANVQITLGFTTTPA